VRQIMADATGISVLLPTTKEPVMLGAAMLGAVASGAFPSLRTAMSALSRLGPSTPPTLPELARFHAAKRQVHAMMQRLDKDSRMLMRDALK